MELHFLILLLIFVVKHVVADYYLQVPYMYENKGKDIGWCRPLADHSGVHAVFTWLIAFVYVASMTDAPLIAVLAASVFAVFDFVTHFVTDRWKATQTTDPLQEWSWRALGIDQGIHQAVGVIITYFMVANYYA